MARFITWFARPSPDGEGPLPALTRAGIAHLYFESIHPFEDGNGRIGRAIAEKALSESLGRPVLTALGATILARRRRYYEELERSSRQNGITNWLMWFAGVAIEAPATSTRDLADLVAKRALVREGERRHARYYLGVPLRPVPHVSIGSGGELVEG
jgi:Fic family protein